MVDADGATNFSDLANLQIRYKQTVNEEGYGFVAGSRKSVVKARENKVERNCIRSFLAWVSNFIITVIVGIKIKVNQYVRF